MKLNKVLFIGGHYKGRSAIQVRCIDIASRLGCDFKLGVAFAEEILGQYSIFVCVKSTLNQTELFKLSQRGMVIWDIIDELPPQRSIAMYLSSTIVAQRLFKGYGRVELIPHHHCNFEGLPNPLRSRRPVWLGSRMWFPQLNGFEFDSYFVERMSREDVAKAFRKTGIGLNLRGVKGVRDVALTVGRIVGLKDQLRAAKKLYEVHLALTSGIKLINCIGFGIPSISSDEPAYHEVGEDCTIFSNLKDCAKWVRALQNDDDLYMDLRKKCLRISREFHIDTIADKYRKLLLSL